MMWLAGNPLATRSSPGTWSKIRFQIIKITYPVWRHFYKGGPQVLIEARLLKPSQISADQLTPTWGGAISTNGSGSRAWILSAEKLKESRNSMNEVFAANSGISMRVTLGGNAGAAQIRSGQGADTFTVDVAPRITQRAIRVAIGGLWSESGPPPRTNTVNCQALLPNGGALIVEGSTNGHDPNVRYFFIFSATAIDSRGNPVKL
jgi:hypothetical protein